MLPDIGNSSHLQWSLMAMMSHVTMMATLTFVQLLVLDVANAATGCHSCLCSP